MSLEEDDVYFTKGDVLSKREWEQHLKEKEKETELLIEIEKSE